MIDAKELKHLFKSKTHKYGGYIRRLLVENSNTADLTYPLSTPNGRSKREAQHSGITIPISRAWYWSQHSGDAEIREKRGIQHKTPKMTTYSNRCCLCLRKEMSELLVTVSASGSQAINRHWHNQDKHNTNNRKKNTVGNEKNESAFHNQKCSLIGSDRRVCSDFAISLDQACYWLYNFKSEIRIRTTG